MMARANSAIHLVMKFGIISYRYKTMYANSEAVTTTCILQSGLAVQQQTENST